jgi:hypothetical protein
MHDELNTSDEAQFDRLADGELSADERRTLLASLDDRPDGWRQCALAFLEAQAWRRQFGAVLRERETMRDSVTTGAAASKNKSYQMNWLALAASLLIAFTLGLAFRGSLPFLHLAAPNPFNQVATVVEPPSAAESNELLNDLSPDDVLTLWVRDDGGRIQPLRVPLVDAVALDRQLGVEFQPGLPADVRQQINDEGYAVESRRRYAPFWLETGRPMLVPVEDTRIVPVNTAVY